MADAVGVTRTRDLGRSGKVSVLEVGPCLRPQVPSPQILRVTPPEWRAISGPSSSRPPVGRLAPNRTRSSSSPPDLRSCLQAATRGTHGATMSKEGYPAQGSSSMEAPSALRRRSTGLVGRNRLSQLATGAHDAAMVSWGVFRRRSRLFRAGAPGAPSSSRHRVLSRTDGRRSGCLRLAPSRERSCAAGCPPAWARSAAAARTLPILLLDEFVSGGLVSRSEDATRSFVELRSEHRVRAAIAV